MDIELVGWIEDSMSEEEARIELADMARDGWR